MYSRMRITPAQAQMESVVFFSNLHFTSLILPLVLAQLSCIISMIAVSDVCSARYWSALIYSIYAVVLKMCCGDGRIWESWPRCFQNPVCSSAWRSIRNPSVAVWVSDSVCMCVFSQSVWCRSHLCNVVYVTDVAGFKRQRELEGKREEEKESV